MASERWRPFTYAELTDIETAAWAEDAEGAMGDDIRRMLPEIAAELEWRGYAKIDGYWQAVGLRGVGS